MKDFLKLVNKRAGIKFLSSANIKGKWKLGMLVFCNFPKWRQYSDKATNLCYYQRIFVPGTYVLFTKHKPRHQSKYLFDEKKPFLVFIFVVESKIKFCNRLEKWSRSCQRTCVAFDTYVWHPIQGSVKENERFFCCSEPRATFKKIPAKMWNQLKEDRA